MDQSATLAVIGACVLSLGIVLAAIGFVSPWWVSYEYGRDDSNGPYVYYDSAYYSSYQGDRYYGDGFPKDDGQVTQQYEDYPDLNGFFSLHYGLWRKCHELFQYYGEKCENAVDTNNLDWYTACQAVGVLGLVTATLALCLLVFWICTHRNSLWVKVMIITLIIVTCILFAVVVLLFGMKAKDNVEEILMYANRNYDEDDIRWEWGYIMMIAAAVMILLSAMFVIPSGPSEWAPSYDYTHWWKKPCYTLSYSQSPQQQQLDRMRDKYGRLTSYICQPAPSQNRKMDLQRLKKTVYRPIFVPEPQATYQTLPM